MTRRHVTQLELKRAGRRSRIRSMMRKAKACNISADEVWTVIASAVEEAAHLQSWRPSEIAMTLADHFADLVKVYGQEEADAAVAFYAGVRARRHADARAAAAALAERNGRQVSDATGEP